MHWHHAKKPRLVVKEGVQATLMAAAGVEASEGVALGAAAAPVEEALAAAQVAQQVASKA